MKTKSGNNNLSLLPYPDTRPLLLAGIRREYRKAQGISIPVGEEDFLRETEEELKWRRIKVRTFQLEIIGDVYSDISAMEELDDLEKNGCGIGMPCRERNRACLNSRIKKGRKTLCMISQVLNGLDCQIKEIKNDSSGFLRKNGFSEKTGDGQEQE